MGARALKGILAAAAVAAVSSAVSWAVARWLDARAQAPKRRLREQIENWENEGGALAPPRRHAPAQ